jgi:hypothetical protein
MYLIIIKSSFNYYIHTQSSSLHTTGAKLQKRVLSFSCSQHYRCCCLYFYHLYYYYYFFFALALFPFLFYSSRAVVLAATTTRFSFLLFFLLFLSLFFLSMLTLFPISKHTALLTGYYKKEHDDERTFRVIARKREKEEETRRLPRCSLFLT